MTIQPISKKPLFNLNLVVQETGIKPDTLRAWERRYSLPTPSRTEGGHRLFSSYDIETIKWLLARQEEGMRISQAVDYWRELISSGIDPLGEAAQEPALPLETEPVAGDRRQLEDLRQQWLESSLAFDEEKATAALDTAFRHYPWETVCTDLIYQGLAEIGERWYQDNITVQQEHFASEVVVKKLQTLIAAAPDPYHPQIVLISNPPGEFHTIASLTLNLLLRYRGWEVTYLGANVPRHHLADALGTINPSLVVMTAARLASAAELLKTSQLLNQHGLPLAFSGSVFSGNPGLADRIPGTYLGQDLDQAVSLAEALLSKPAQSENQAIEPSPYLDLVKKFKSKLTYLENAALLRLEETTAEDLPVDLIRDTYEYFLLDVLAALELGDINFLESNLSWVTGLLISRDFEPGYVKKYLESFIAVSRETLGSEADPVLDWMEDYAANLPTREDR